MSTQFPAIPAINTLAPELQRILGPVKEILEIGLGRRGNASFLTVPTLSAQVQKSVDGGAISVPGTAITGTVVSSPATITPGTPAGLGASGALASVILSWTAAAYTGHAYTEIWRSATNDLGAAVRVGSTPGEVYADDVGDTGVVYYYWIRFVSTSDTAGAYNAGTTGGTSATTSTVGTTNIANAAITNAKIGALAVDSANIAAAAIVEAKIGTAAVTEAKIGAAAITSAKIGAAAVGTAAIADAAITNAKIDRASVNKLVVVTADMQDASVDTLQLAGNAVVLPESAYTAGPASYYNGAGGFTYASPVEHTIQTKSITVPSTASTQPIFVIAAAHMAGTWDTTGSDVMNVTFEIYRDSTLLYSGDSQSLVSISTSYVQDMYAVADTPGAGTFTYTIVAKYGVDALGTVSNATFYWRASSLLLTLNKR